uniref:Uncharacterized protein n=1 Tax=Arundo donax TaxID=35708 RepID=A0A0A9H2I8_ARUDO
MREQEKDLHLGGRRVGSSSSRLPSSARPSKLQRTILAKETYVHL